ncbi:DUF2953 domain-containing protein [Clostridium botulinum]|uniref:DUF2953 domain-containing protein n=1 Tax=Clostridium botulinum C/D str. DC5 TaxID=1443128 RepID=A0A0A0IMU0_CLOBO|nr:DUF2953 domain-containing protein [Clostridium botulinum]KEI07075.1 hypothetical protein Z952_02230 [Clostridium botulinum C/D str. BKT75002]KEI12152.1 hypothetical protein Z954_06375 [Clostridium botulinum C/D str. BKT2873]KGM96837.1 hypothetical protein Z956_02090 [Clostridium botulinum D str. CCUG 7971]KGN01949.1 hypothetical protein Z955_00685 [Clostridium botulinum C/D str. DC5]KOC48586.1 hypothetical protein ADU88_08220 [Clostridium botulinum]
MIWIGAILLLFIIPLPLLLEVIYENNKLYVYIYNLKIYPSSKVIKSMPEPKPNGILPKLVYINTFKAIYQRCRHYIYNSLLSFNINITYGFQDAAITGIFFGILQSTVSGLHYLLDSIFNLKHFNSNINPIFNNSIFKIKIKSIIFINLGKIIYMSILVFRAFKQAAKYHLKPKEVS